MQKLALGTAVKVPVSTRDRFRAARCPDSASLLPELDQLSGSHKYFKNAPICVASSA